MKSFERDGKTFIANDDVYKYIVEQDKQIAEVKHQKFLTEKKLIECSDKWWKQEDKIKELKAANADLHNLGLKLALQREKDKQQITKLRDKAREIIQIYILTTPADGVSSPQMVVSKLSKPILELNELIK